MDLSSSLPEASPAAAFRQALPWAFVVGPGLVIHCRHLDFQDLLVSGLIPLPVLEHFKAVMGTDGMSLNDLLATEDRREVTLQIARTYASRVAVTPRISLERVDDPSVLCVGPADDAASWDLTPSILVRMLNQGISRRLGVDASVLGAMFRGAQPAAASPAASNGGAVSDATEPLATSGDATDVGPGPVDAGDPADESGPRDLSVGD